MEDLAQVGILLFKFRIDEPLGRCAPVAYTHLTLPTLATV